MSNFPSQVKNIPKWHQKKYFSHETGGGKGDTPREYSKERQDNYKANSFWDNCEFEKRKILKLATG